MADSDDILKEFAEFMQAKRDSESESTDASEEVEIWDKDGRGARVRKADALPFLKSFGLFPDQVDAGDSDPDKSGKNDGKGSPKTSKPKPTGPSQNAARRYFSKGAGN